MDKKTEEINKNQSWTMAHPNDTAPSTTQHREHQRLAFMVKWMRYVIRTSGFDIKTIGSRQSKTLFYSSIRPSGAKYHNTKHTDRVSQKMRAREPLLRQSGPWHDMERENQELVEFSEEEIPKWIQKHIQSRPAAEFVAVAVKAVTEIPAEWENSGGELLQALARE